MPVNPQEDYYSIGCERHGIGTEFYDTPFEHRVTGEWRRDKLVIDKDVTITNGYGYKYIGRVTWHDAVFPTH
jgi:hypothetical protein